MRNILSLKTGKARRPDRFVLLCAAALALTLTGCGQMSLQESGAAQTAPPPPSAEQAAPAVTGDPIVDTAPFDLHPAGSKGALGVNIDTYLSGATSEDDRVQRLEKALVAMQRDLDKAAPAIQRISVLESEILLMRKQANKSVGTLPVASASASPIVPEPEESAAPPQSAPVPLKAEEEKQTAPAEDKKPSAPLPVTPADNGTPHVEKLRAGMDGHKTRLVFDIRGKTSYTHDLDNDEKILVVDLPQAGWSAAMKGGGMGSPLIASYSVQPSSNGKGSMLVVQLKSAAKITGEGTIGASAQNPDSRIYIDLAAQ